MGCCIGDCCVMDCGFCCIIDFCSDSGCSYHPQENKTEAHAKKIADELADMKKYAAESTKKIESEMMDSINGDVKNLIQIVNRFNQTEYGGKKLNINIKLLEEKNAELRKEVVIVSIIFRKFIFKHCRQLGDRCSLSFR